MADVPLINGRRYSFASLEFTLQTFDDAGAIKNSEIFIEVSALTFEDVLEIADVPGANQAPVGWTSGIYKPADSSFSLPMSSFQQGIVERIGNGWLGSNLKVVAKFGNTGEPLTSVEILGIISGAADDGAAGSPDALQTKVTMKTMVIKRNGITPLAQHLI